jgi:undecaprenyl-diphosphatase
MIKLVRSMTEIIEIVKSIDREILLAVNHSGNAFLDKVMLLISSRFTWIPFYILLAVFIYLKHKKILFSVILAVAVLIFMSDRSSVIIKNTAERYRPCHHVYLSPQLHLPDGCGGLYGFPSSHAANSSALAVFLILIFKSNRKALSFAFIAYCLLVGYSRIYLGRHYFTDVLAGWMLGASCAIVIYLLFQKIIKHVPTKNYP